MLSDASFSLSMGLLPAQGDHLWKGGWESQAGWLALALPSLRWDCRWLVGLLDDFGALMVLVETGGGRTLLMGRHEHLLK